MHEEQSITKSSVVARRSRREEKHVMKVLERNSLELVVAATTAFLSPLVGLLQYRSIALFVIVTRVLTLINTPTYHRQTHTVNMRMLSCAAGCFLATCLHSWTHLTPW